MMERDTWLSFDPIMKLMVLLFLTVVCASAYAQVKPVEGIVFDKDSKERIARVDVVNLNTGASIYNNLKAEFKIAAKPGERLIFSKQGYFNDTVNVVNGEAIAVYLKPTGIQLKPVTVIGSFITPQNQLEANERLYNKAYGSLANRDLLSFGNGGAGISIDALYNYFSREGRNAAKLREVIDQDYRENVIDYRFNHTLVANITGLKEPRLTDFMQKYRPGYYFATQTSDYDFVIYIRNNYRRYLRNPNAFALQTLTLK